MSYPNARTIHIHPAAPAKPALGVPCNGCGVCCLYEPCPVGMLLSRKRRGACHALVWSEAQQIYRCRAVENPTVAVTRALPSRLYWLARPLGALLGLVAARWIAAGIGCDSTLEAPAQSTTMPMHSTPSPAPSDKT